VYSAGESEEIVGKAIAGRRDEIVLATKVHMPMGEESNRRGNSRRWIVAEVEKSLRRLGTDWVDVYQVHRYDPAVDLQASTRAVRLPERWDLSLAENQRKLDAANVLAHLAEEVSGRLIRLS